MRAALRCRARRARPPSHRARRLRRRPAWHQCASETSPSGAQYAMCCCLTPRSPFPLQSLALLGSIRRRGSARLRASMRLTVLEPLLISLSTSTPAGGTNRRPWCSGCGCHAACAPVRSEVTGVMRGGARLRRSQTPCAAVLAALDGPRRCVWGAAEGRQDRHAAARFNRGACESVWLPGKAYPSTGERAGRCPRAPAR